MARWEVGDDKRAASYSIDGNHWVEVHKTDEGLVIDSWERVGDEDTCVFTTWFLDAELLGEANVDDVHRGCLPTAGGLAQDTTGGYSGSSEGPPPGEPV